MPSFLLICDEWSPTRGGISTFNRRLATALAAAGQHTVCLACAATPADHGDAEARGVTLLTAERTPDGPNLYVPSAAVLEHAPDVVIGHDRITGPVAWTYVAKYLRASLVHIVHTAPPEIEPYKSRPGASERIEARERLTRRIAARADVVAAVGPRLARYADAVIGDGFGAVPVLRLDPGINVPDGEAGRQRRVPASPTVLVLGRTDEIVLKGLDIAAMAVAALTGTPGPVLRIRGAPAAACDALRDRLIELAGLARDRVDVRSFTDEPDQAGHDLRLAALCVLPSRVEGFGLAALEAIGVGTPVLVSDKSGVAETLRDRLGRFARRMIVEVVDDSARDVPVWSAAIQRVLDDLPDAFVYAHEVRRRLAGELSWDATARTLLRRMSLPDNVVAL